MPLYDFRCDEHGEFEDVWAKADESVQCGECSRYMTRLISAPYVSPDLEPYLEHNIGSDPIWIKSRQHRAEELYKRGLNIANDTSGRINNSEPSKGER